MGTVLALMRRLVLTLLLFSTAVACGSKSDDVGLKETLLAALKARKEAKKAEGQPKAPPFVLTRQSIKHIEKPLLRISAQTLGVKNLFAQVAQNGAYRTYMNNLKMSVTFKGGIITATRGFGLDLLSQGLSIASEEMFTEPETETEKTYTRTQQQLTKIKKIVEFNFNCTLVKGPVETVTIVEIDYPLVTYTEVCRNAVRAFRNTYWVEQETGQIWKSAQSIGEQAGYFITEVLVP